MKIKLSQLAELDLCEAEDYIAKDNPSAGLALVERVYDAINYLSVFPGMGRPGRQAHTKELVVNGTPFVVIYQIKATIIYVYRVIHGARKWP